MKFAWNAKVYSECFVFCGVFRENTREIPAKCEIRIVYSRPNNTRAVRGLLFHVECFFHSLLTRFEPLYTNTFHIGPSDGTVSRYTLGLKIYAATSSVEKKTNILDPSDPYQDIYVEIECINTKHLLWTE